MRLALRNLSIILLIGLLLGALTSFGQTFIPEPFKQLANAYSVWLFASFVIGMLLASYKWAVAGGAAVQYLAILAYYLLSIVRFDSGFSVASNLIWIVGGTLVGPVAAYLGHAVRAGSKWRPYGISFMTALFFSEALYQFIILRYIGEGSCFLVIGLGFLSVMLFCEKRHLATIAATIPLTILMFVGYAYVLVSISGG